MAGVPRLLASRKTCRVAAGGVTMDKAVSVGEGRADMFGSAGKGSSWLARVMVAAVGLIGVTGRLWLIYQSKTRRGKKKREDSVSKEKKKKGHNEECPHAPKKRRPEGFNAATY